MISFNDFAKLDLRVGKILEVQDIAGADKLYLLKVDIGEKVIQLVAGIKPFYKKEDLKDKLIVVLVNLEPKTIRGFTSQGMLLAASSQDKISLIGPYEEIKVGSKIR
jgi:methionyl-tRNA synthetase